jgi:putative ABC transport system ATP-binding protein
MVMDASHFLTVTHLSKDVACGDSKIQILNDVNFTVKTGESVAILGRSGSGKTTLLTLLAGLDLPTSGDIQFEEHSLAALSEEERATLRGEAVGFVFQSFQLIPTLTALENVMLPLEIQYLPYQECKLQATRWLNKLGLSERVNHYPTKLSGGEQQRVAIARAFVTQPRIIFADEITGNLDTHTGKVIADMLFTLNAELGTTLVLVTHDDTLAARCEQRYYLQEGSLQPC